MSSRRGFMRQSRELVGSAARPSSRGWLACRYAADSMISRCSHLSDMPLAMKRADRSSSNSGCVGLSPWTPKSLSVATSGLPKCQPQTRFTITRAASGPLWVKMSSANSRRPEPCLKVVSPLESTVRNWRGASAPGAATLACGRMFMSRATPGRMSTLVRSGSLPSIQIPASNTDCVKGRSEAPGRRPLAAAGGGTGAGGAAGAAASRLAPPWFGAL